jgi:hypothetical protein
MANEITTTTFDDLTHTSLVQPVIIRALTEKPGLFRFCREFNIIDQSTNAAKLPTETSYWGSANDRGASVDTEFNGTEATSLSNTAFSTGSVTCTAAEYGVAHALTDNVAEDSVRGIDIMDLIKGRMLFVHMLAWEDDYIANYANLSQTVGTTNTAITVAQMVAAQQGLAYPWRRGRRPRVRSRQPGRDEPRVGADRDERGCGCVRALGGSSHRLRADERQRHGRIPQGDAVPWYPGLHDWHDRHCQRGRRCGLGVHRSVHGVQRRVRRDDSLHRVEASAVLRDAAPGEAPRHGPRHVGPPRFRRAPGRLGYRNHHEGDLIALPAGRA